MTSEQFLDYAASDSCVQAYIQKYPEKAKQDVENFARKKRVRALLYLFGEKALELLITILQNFLIKKYA